MYPELIYSINRIINYPSLKPEVKVMFKKSVILFSIIIITLFIVGCDKDSTGSTAGKPKPVPGVATNIELTVHPSETGEPSQTLLMEAEGDIVIDLGDSISASDYYIYAEADNYYSELYNCQKGESITVDLDSVAGPDKTMTGTIFVFQSFWFDIYFANETMTLHGPYNISRTVTTDDQGRYSIGVLPLGDYTLEFTVHEFPIVLNLNNSLAMDCLDLSFPDPYQIDAPNIYLYPETESDISVTLNFPNGGFVNLSDPPYNDGWNVTVTPDGIIDDQYDYLFYKAILPTQPNANSGWLLTTANLEPEFRVLLVELGFVGREIDDFVEFWVPLLGDAPYYGIYPQDVESFVELKVDPPPKSTLRVFFLILPFEQEITIPVPREYDYFIRDGFTVVEWGVFAPHFNVVH